VRVHPRIQIRRSYIADDDVRAAFELERRRRAVVRENTDPPQTVGIGWDRKGRELEWVAVQEPDNNWLIYHCAPATDSVKNELSLMDRKPKWQRTRQ